MKDQPNIVARLRAYTQHNRPVLASDLKEAADELVHLRKTLESFVRGVQSAAGIEESPDDLSMEGLGRIVDRVGDLRDATRNETESTAVVATLPTERFDEIERRLALLESSLRITRRRLVMAGEAMQGGDGMEAAKVMMGFRDAS